MSYDRKNFLSIMLVVGFCFNCSPVPERTNIYPLKIVAIYENKTPQATSEAYLETESELLKPYLPLNYGEHPIQILNLNLDNDEHFEQLLIIKTAGNGSEELKLMVIDWDVEKNHYLSWQTQLLATEEKTIRLDVKDLIGDNSLQIIASGMNAMGEVTLEIFRQLPIPGHLSYRSIFKLASSGTIEIAETDPSVGYYGGHRYGGSFPIYVLKANPGPSFSKELIREIYQFSYASGRYEFSRQDTISFKSTGDEILDSLYKSNSTEPFYSFINGIWQTSDISDKRTVLFDPERNKISFYMPGVEEVYKIKFSRRSLFNSITLYTENELLRSIQPIITITIISSSEISISLTEYSTMEQWLDEQWGGSYQRFAVDSSPASYAFLNYKTQVEPLPYTFKGKYQSATGLLLTFYQPNKLSLQDGKVSQEGSFALLTLTNQETHRYLLAIKFIKNLGLQISNAYYLLELPSPPSEITEIRSFKLKEVTLNTLTFKETKGESLVFYKVEN